MHVPLRIFLLGGFRVAVNGRVIDDRAWRRRKSASLVKCLALTPGGRVHREHLQDLLWPDLAPDAAANNLHSTLHVARRLLQPDPPPNASSFLALHGETLVLAPTGAVWIDVDAFTIAAAAARGSDDPVAVEAALALHGGELLPEDRYQDWTADRRPQRSSRRLAAT